MSDLISRQAAIDALARTAREKFNLSDEFNHYLAGLMDGDTAIRQLPSAQPQRMRGRWQEITASDCSGYDPVLAGYDDPVVGYVCSTCHEGYKKEVMGKVTWNYCPNCGADMRGKQDD